MEKDPRVLRIPGYLNDAELARVIRAADHVVLPYRRVLNSGSAMLALTLGRPVLLPRTPTFEALAEHVGPGWVALFDGTPDAARLSALGEEERPAPVDLSWCSWERITEMLSSLWATHPAARSGWAG
jgi:beta-1,4-mannosyltransferase